MQKNVDIKLLYDDKKIRARVCELADEILSDYSDDEAQIVCVGVLRGAVIFYSDLVKAMASDRIIFDFIRVSSYGEGTTTSGNVNLIENMTESVKGKHVLIVEDIVDSGLTLQFLRKYFAKLGCIDVKAVALLDKPNSRQIEISADYVGFYLRSSAFVVGYGLDYDQAYRNLNGIFQLVGK